MEFFKYFILFSIVLIVIIIIQKLKSKTINYFKNSKVTMLQEESCKRPVSMQEFIDVMIQPKEVKRAILNTIFLINGMFPLIIMLYAYYEYMTFNISHVIFAVLIPFDIISLIYLLFHKKLNLFIFLYTGISYIALSTCSLVLSCRIAYVTLSSSKYTLLIPIYIIAYILCSLIFCIYYIGKLNKSPFVKSNAFKILIATILTPIILFIIINISNSLIGESGVFSLTLFIMSLCFSPSYTHIYKFFYIYKTNKKEMI